METTASKGKEIRIPGPDHPITISLAEGRVRVTVAGRIVAESTRALRLEEKGGENLVWSGVPDARRAAVAAIPETLLPGLLFGGVGLFVMIYEYAGSSTMPKTSSRSLSPILAALVMGLPFVIAGLINLLRPLWIYWRRLNTSYGVTNQRVMVLSLRTTVRAIRDSLREADQTFSARRRIIGSVSAKGTSCSKVSSAEMDCVGRSGTTSLSSIPFGPARRAE